MQSLAEASAQPPDRDWQGPHVHYDLVKEFVIALVVVALLAVALAVVFSSPDEHAVTIRQWAQRAPGDFLATAATELDGSSPSASYGPPYNHNGTSQSIFFLHLEHWAGVHAPVNSAVDFVLRPLGVAAQSNSLLAGDLAAYADASSDQRSGWTTAFEKSMSDVHFSGTSVLLPNGDYGPIAPMMATLLTMARGGSLDADLLSSPQFYGTDYTAPLLFLADGTYLAEKGHAQHLSGDQWGMMNETGSFPGQAWLWLYTMWYQIPPFTTSANADALIWGLMMVLTVLLLFVPLVPGLRDIPRVVPVHRLIWRDHYRRLAEERAAGSAPR